MVRDIVRKTANEHASPYESTVKVSVPTKLKRARGGQFGAHVATLPGNPYGEHTLAELIQTS